MESIGIIEVNTCINDKWSNDTLRGDATVGGACNFGGKVAGSGGAWFGITEVVGNIRGSSVGSGGRHIAST